MAQGGRKGGGCDDFGIADPCGFGTGSGGAEEHAACFGGGEGGRECADDGEEGAVEAEFAQGDGAFDGIGGDDFERAEEGERDGQVKMAACLGEVGGGEIDGDALGGKGDAKRGEGGANAVFRFGDGFVGEADETEGGDAGGDGALDFDETGRNAFESDRIGASDHGSRPEINLSER